MVFIDAGNGLCPLNSRRQCRDASLLSTPPTGETYETQATMAGSPTVPCGWRISMSQAQGKQVNLG